MSYQVRNAKRALRDTFEARNVNERGEVFADTSHRAAGGIGFSTMEALQAFCNVNNLQLQYADEYGERGYSDAPKGILLCNWNHIPKSLQTRLEAQGVELEWEDEWYVSSESTPCKAWRTQGDSHGWESSLLMCDGFMLTRDDAESDPSTWIAECENEPSRPLPSWFDDEWLEAAHYRLRDPDERLETGFHPGQNDSAEDIGAALTKEGRDYVLQVTDRGQFDVHWRVWVKRREAKRDLFLSDSRGIYIPRDFAQCVERDKVTGITDENYATLEAGPDHEWYWEAWEEVCNKAVLTDSKGTAYTLDQDGDLWLIEQGAEYDESEDAYYID